MTVDCQFYLVLPKLTIFLALDNALTLVYMSYFSPFIRVCNLANFMKTLNTKCEYGLYRKNLLCFYQPMLISFKQTHFHHNTVFVTNFSLIIDFISAFKLITTQARAKTFEKVSSLYWCRN